MLLTLERETEQEIGPAKIGIISLRPVTTSTGPSYPQISSSAPIDIGGSIDPRWRADFLSHETGRDRTGLSGEPDFVIELEGETIAIEIYATSLPDPAQLVKVIQETRLVVSEQLVWGRPLERLRASLGRLRKAGLDVQVEPAVWRFLGSALCHVAERVLDVIFREQRKGLPAKSMELTTFSDPEAEIREEEMVFIVRLRCGTEEALEVWDELSSKVDALKSELSASGARLLDEKIAIEVEWE